MAGRVGRVLALVAASGAGLLASVVSAGALTPTQAAARGVISQPSGRGVLGPPRSVNLRKAALASPPAGEHPALALPFLAGPSRTSPGSHPVTVTPRVLSPANGAAQPHTSQPLATTSSPGILSTFPAASLNADIAAFGSDQNFAPPDTQVAAGPTDLVAPVNDTLWVWSKTGTALLDADLNTFFPVPSGYSFSDPRVAYDAAMSRWLLSGLSFDSSNDSIVYLAVSETSDPTGNWYVYTVNSRAGVLQDQPKLGFDAAVVVLSWNDFSGSPQAFSGQETWVLNESELLTGATVSEQFFRPDTTRFDVVPAISLTSSSTAYAAYNDSCTSTTSCTAVVAAIGVVALTGTPPSAVTWTESDPAITPTTQPPAADQPGAPASIATTDDRFLTVAYDGGTLYVSGNDGCIPTGDSVVRPCARLIEVAVGSSPTVPVDGDLRYVGGDLYYPAVVPDANGDVFMAATFSSASVYPEATGLTIAAGASSFSGVLFQPGSGTYSYSGCASTGCRWGDYSGAAVDPSNPSDVWLAGEYAPTSGSDWGTAIGEMTLAAPSVTGLSPSTGSTSGSTAVTVFGSNFTLNATVDFGATAATSVTVVSPSQLTAVSPAEAAGTVDLTVTTPSGTSATSAADQFTYLAGGAYTAVTPTRLLDTRRTGGTLGPNSSLRLTVTGGSVPANATAVALNVTVTGTTSASDLTVYPQGEAAPNASNLNWVGGETVPNLVIVPVGAGGQVEFYNALGSTDLVVDLEGYFVPEGLGSTAGSYVPLTPSRITDTRSGSGDPNAGAALDAGGILNIQVMGAGGVPASGVTAALLNVTVTNTNSGSDLTVYPQLAPRPTASNLNWVAGDTVANRVVVPVSSNGQISVYNDAGSTDVIVDVNGYFTDGSSTPSNASLYTPITPVRLVDTRGDGGYPGAGSTLGAGGTYTAQLSGAGGISSAATAAVLNVTATNTTAASDFTVYPGGVMPNASDVNWSAGQTVPNLTVATLSGTGSVTVYNVAGSADLVIDAFGYFSPG